MEGGRNPFLVSILLAALLSQNVLTPVMSCDFPTIPCPIPSHGTPPSHSGGGSYGRPPPHASHGGGGAYGTPPSHAHHGGGSYGKPPSPPHHGGGKPCPPTRPRGHHAKPPSHGKPPPPLVPVPPTPIVTPTPQVPIVDPNIHPITGTCNFWRTHPALIWGVIGYWGTIGGLFGTPTIRIFGFDPTILQALGCPRTDGYGALLREGAASLLNSMSSSNFPFTHQQVKDAFLASLASDQLASAQAQRFKLANEGHLKN